MREDTEFDEKDDKTCLFEAVDPMVVKMLTPRYEEKKPRTIPHKLNWGPAHNAEFIGLICDSRNTTWNSGKPSTMQIIMNDSIPADCLVNVVKKKSG